jgi:hypothetical protein
MMADIDEMSKPNSAPPVHVSIHVAIAETREKLKRKEVEAGASSPMTDTAAMKYMLPTLYMLARDV